MQLMQELKQGLLGCSFWGYTACQLPLHPLIRPSENKENLQNTAHGYHTTASNARLPTILVPSCKRPGRVGALSVGLARPGALLEGSAQCTDRSIVGRFDVRMQGLRRLHDYGSLGAQGFPGFLNPGPENCNSNGQGACPSFREPGLCGWICLYSIFRC